MSRNVPPIETIALLSRNTRSGRILDSINDQPRDDDIGQHAGWGAGEDLDAPPVEERTGPALAPFLRYRGGDRAWRLALGCLWLPAIVVVITIEDWLHVPQNVQWISLGVVFVVFNLVAFVPDSRRR